jgi:ribose 5-phosphate isomerase B
MIFIGADHAGFKVKEKIKKILEKIKTPYVDCGTTGLKSTDYPMIARVVAKKVATTKEQGILVCGTGIGMSIAANKVKGIRAARVLSKKDALLAKQHNNANIITLPGRGKTTNKKIEEIIITWMQTEPSSEKRHKKRVLQIKKLEK